MSNPPTTPTHRRPPAVRHRLPFEVCRTDTDEDEDRPVVVAAVVLAVAVALLAVILNLGVG